MKLGLFVIELVVIAVFVLTLDKINTGVKIKQISRVLIALALVASLWDVFLCSGDGSFNLCGMFTLLLIIPLFAILSVLGLAIFAYKKYKGRAHD